MLRLFSFDCELGYICLQKPSHILACNLQADSISWLYMASDLSVVDWKHEVIFERVRAKYDHVLYQNKVRTNDDIVIVGGGGNLYMNLRRSRDCLWMSCVAAGRCGRVGKMWFQWKFVSSRCFVDLFWGSVTLST